MTPELRRRLGAKRAEVSHIILHEMRVRGYSGASLARDLGCSGANVSKTISGGGHSPLVLDALRELGVPEEYLCDPRRAAVPALGRLRAV
ncbi:MAG: XRE family transcriptional regulator [Desulfovibrio sp.]|jgi:biotin operon repressor|nr:XRE family transcriptional regulator [Desulfovibrio sp.]